MNEPQLESVSDDGPVMAGLLAKIRQLYQYSLKKDLLEPSEAEVMIGELRKLHGSDKRKIYLRLVWEGNSDAANSGLAHYFYKEFYS